MKTLNSQEIMQVSGGMRPWKHKLYNISAGAAAFGLIGAVMGYHNNGLQGAIDGSEYAVLGGLVAVLAEGVAGLAELYLYGDTPGFLHSGGGDDDITPRPWVPRR